MRTILTILIGFLVPTAVLSNEILPEEWRVDRKEMSEPLDPETRVHVTNPFGDIRVRNHHKPEVYVLVNAQRHRDDPLRFEIDFCESENSLAITASVDPHDESVPEAFLRRRMDMTVFLPRANDLSLETTDGFIESRGMAGNLKIQSESGNVRTRHAGEIAINTTYGNVEAVLLDLRWSQDGYFETLTGAVEVHVANNANLDIAMETGGNLTTDYTITVESDEETSVKNAQSRLGNGGKTLTLKSTTGDISLFRSEIEQPNE